MHISRTFAALLVATGLAVAVPAFAHPQLVVADPAQGATVAKVSQVTLTFSEPLIAQMSGIDVVMTGMPGMDHHAAMKMTGVRVSVGADGKSLVASLPRPLPVGSYEADWHAVSTDTHRVIGKLTFTVK
jgi:methionine-rich copper-binding protein CopC